MSHSSREKKTVQLQYVQLYISYILKNQFFKLEIQYCVLNFKYRITCHKTLASSVKISEYAYLQTSSNAIGDRSRLKLELFYISVFTFTAVAISRKG